MAHFFFKSEIGEYDSIYNNSFLLVFIHCFDKYILSVYHVLDFVVVVYIDLKFATYSREHCIFKNIFVFNWKIISLQYCVVSTLYQHASATVIHMSLPSQTSLPTPTPSHLMPVSNEHFNWSDSFNLYLCNHRKSPYLLVTFTLSKVKQE